MTKKYDLWGIFTVWFDGIVALPTAFCGFIWALMVACVCIPLAFVYILIARPPRHQWEAIGEWIRDRVRTAHTGRIDEEA